MTATTPGGTRPFWAATPARMVRRGHFRSAGERVERDGRTYQCGPMFAEWEAPRSSRAPIRSCWRMAQTLSFLSPRLNATAGRETVEYQEQANMVKLMLPAGDIDFIAAAPVIPGARPVMTRIGDRMVALEATAEILAKKLAYRADGFKARDVFDMATALALDPPSAMAALAATRRTRPALLDTLRRMQSRLAAGYAKDIDMTDTGRQHATDMLPRLLQAVAEADRLGAGPAQAPVRRVTRGRPDGMEP